jgi:hypothetical protein
MDLYLLAKSEHLCQNWALLTILSHWENSLYSYESLGIDLSHLKETFRQNGFSNYAVIYTLV